ncbi:hypothetical protein J1N35_001390 [Gossypium stocksii]|uniref:Uncharacterized protein n=1 Tax=Gossypium stocksii TaxID=47602 RepID=A0A9D3WIV0_9ROSI|nr:hypothetical protein J1N35_001390 [Gossypium stocksii]
MAMLQHMQLYQQDYWRYPKIWDDSIRDAFKKYIMSFVFVPEFPNFILEPWTPILRKEKDKLNSEGFANK